MEYRTIKGIKHYVFDTEKEFRNSLGPDMELWDDWRTAPQGSWVRSDDARIVQILHKKDSFDHKDTFPTTDRAYGYIRTVVGTFFAHPKHKMDTDFDKHPCRYTFSGHQPHKSVKTGLTKRERAWMMAVISGQNPVDAYLEVFPTEKRSTAESAVYSLLREDRIMDKITALARQHADTLGLDLEFVLKAHKDICESEVQKGATKVASLRELCKILDYYPKDMSADAGRMLDEGIISDAEYDEIEGTTTTGAAHDAIGPGTDGSDGVDEGSGAVEGEVQPPAASQDTDGPTEDTEGDTDTPGID